MEEHESCSPAPKRRRSRTKQVDVSPNEGILQLLTEIEASAKGNFATTIRRAKKSIAACPIPIRSAEDAGRIKYVGDWLKTRIAAHLAKNPFLDPSETASGSAAPSSVIAPAATQTRTRKEPYVPRYRSGPYAILLALLEGEDQGQAFLKKAELSVRAQPFADEPIRDKSGAAKSSRYAYDGWSSVGRTLIPKQLVIKLSCPAKYSLTEKGRALACRLRDSQSAEADIVTTFNPGASSAVRAGPSAKEPSQPPEPQQGRGRPRKNAPISKKDESTPPRAPNTAASPVLPISYDPAQVLLASQVVTALQSEGHPAQLCMEALKSVLDGGQVPSTAPALRVLILHKLAATSEEPVVIAPCAAPDSALVPASVPSSDLIVIDSDDDSATMNLISRESPEKSWRAVTQAPVRISEPVSENLSTRASTTRQELSSSKGSSIPSGTVILVLDSREKLGSGTGRSCAKLAGKIQSAGVPVEVRTLPVGDAVFIRRCVTTGCDIMLDVVIERKAADDFASSVKDGRVLRQSYSMQNSRLSRRMFIIEGSFEKLELSKQELNRLNKMVANLDVSHGFFVKHTQNTAETVAFYANIHRRLQGNSSAPSDRSETYEAWNSRMNRFNSSLSIGQLFQLQLAQIPGMGASRAKILTDMGVRTPADLTAVLSPLSDDQARSFIKDELEKRGLRQWPVSSISNIFEFATSEKYGTHMV